MGRFQFGTVCALMITLGSHVYPQNPLGASWGPTYGFPPYKAETFVPQMRELGLGFSRVTLYWSQLEPKQGEERWDDLDAYVQQLNTPEEGMVTLACASPWAARTKAWVFPSSPAIDSDAYYAFVQRVVRHVKGKVRYFQSETEPNNPFFWAGTPEEYAHQQKVFYQAVKDADPTAMVVLAGSDGLFDPSGKDPLPGQDANLAYWRRILSDVQGKFDLFDLHLYGDTYTIPARVELVRTMMRDAGAEKPVMTAEYGGPGFFEFKTNRHWFAQLQGPGASADNVRKLRDGAATLPLETRMFLTPDDPEAAAQRIRLQTEDIAVRNVLALSSGIVRTAFFSVWHDSSDRDAPNTVLYGSYSLFDHDVAGILGRRLPPAGVLARLAAALSGKTSMQQIVIDDHPDLFAFRVERAGRKPLLIAWRRPASLGNVSDPLNISISWNSTPGHGITMDGKPFSFLYKNAHVTLAVSDMPVLMD